jgi:hypothetical protein
MLIVVESFICLSWHVMTTLCNEVDQVYLGGVNDHHISKGANVIS